MIPLFGRISLLSLAMLLMHTGNLRADVVALLNQLNYDVQIEMSHGKEENQTFTLKAGQAQGFPVGREPVLRIAFRTGPDAYRLEPYNAYVLLSTREGDRVQGVKLSGKLPATDDIALAPKAWKVKQLDLELFRDNSEPMTEAAWQKTLESRVQAASTKLEAQIGVKLSIQSIKPWQAVPKEPVWKKQYQQFVADNQTPVDRLAIAYLNQAISDDDNDWGETARLNNRQLLLPAKIPENEIEREELLIHQIGLYLGAVRTPDGNSVMRPSLGDKQAMRKAFLIQFDVLNVLITRTWLNAFPNDQVLNWAKLSDRTKSRLKVLYKTMYEMNKSDGLIADYLGELGENVERVKPMIAPMKPAVEPKAPNIPIDPNDLSAKEKAVRAVVRAVVLRGKELEKSNPKAIKGDDLTTEYIRAAADVASIQEPTLQATSFLLGLGIALDDSVVLREQILTQKLCEAVESDDERSERIRVLKNPTLRNRRDLCQHFVISAALCELGGAKAAEAVGLAKELKDMNGQSGFSFADLAADIAGIEFAKQVQAKPESLRDLAKNFSAEDYCPDVKDFPEGFTAERFKQEFGSTDDPRFVQMVTKIRQAIEK